MVCSLPLPSHLQMVDCVRAQTVLFACTQEQLQVIVYRRLISGLCLDCPWQRIDRLSHLSHTIMLGLGFKTQRCVQEFGKVQSTILKQVLLSVIV